MSAPITISAPTSPDGIPMPVTSIASAANNATVAQDKQLLSRLLVSYQTALDNGFTAAELKSVARQISDAAQLAGVTYRLPTANASSDAGSTAAVTALSAATTATTAVPADVAKVNVST